MHGLLVGNDYGEGNWAKYDKATTSAAPAVGGSSLFGAASSREYSRTVIWSWTRNRRKSSRKKRSWCTGNHGRRSLIAIQMLWHRVKLLRYSTHWLGHSLLSLYWYDNHLQQLHQRQWISDQSAKEGNHECNCNCNSLLCYWHISFSHMNYVPLYIITFSEDHITSFKFQRLQFCFANFMRVLALSISLFLVLSFSLRSMCSLKFEPWRCKIFLEVFSANLDRMIGGVVTQWIVAARIFCGWNNAPQPKKSSWCQRARVPSYGNTAQSL